MTAAAALRFIRRKSLEARRRSTTPRAGDSGGLVPLRGQPNCVWGSDPGPSPTGTPCPKSRGQTPGHVLPGFDAPRSFVAEPNLFGAAVTRPAVSTNEKGFPREASTRP